MDPPTHPLIHLPVISPFLPSCPHSDSLPRALKQSGTGLGVRCPGRGLRLFLCGKGREWELRPETGRLERWLLTSCPFGLEVTVPDSLNWVKPSSFSGESVWKGQLRCVHASAGPPAGSDCVCAVSVAESCLTLYDFMDSNPPGSSVHGILQARIRE